jgi:hypothetical protein
MFFFQLLFILLVAAVLFIGLLVVVGYIMQKPGQDELKNLEAEYIEFLSKLHTELSDFKNKSGFDKNMAIKTFDSISHTSLLYWVNNSILYSSELVDLIDENDYSRKEFTDNVVRKIRDLLRSKVSFKPLEYSEFDKFKPIQIPIDKIVYYSEKGELYKNTSLAGGGSSLGGAIVGGVLAGGVGAVIGSRNKVESKIITTDNREVVLVYYEGEKLFKKKLDYKTLEIFDQLIPEKNYEFIQMQHIQKQQEKI